MQNAECRVQSTKTFVGVELSGNLQGARQLQKNIAVPKGAAISRFSVFYACWRNFLKENEIISFLGVQGGEEKDRMLEVQLWEPQGSLQTLQCRAYG